MAAAPEPTFHLFPRLPAEIQLAIWRECLPHRVCEIDIPSACILFNLPPRAPSPCNLWQTTFLNGLPPLIASVCRTSRDVAFEAVSNEETPPEARWVSNNLSSSCPDLVRDSVHINWTPAYDVEYAGAGCPLRRLAWGAALASGGGSLMLDFLEYSFRHPLPRRIQILNRLPSWMVVMRVVVVHTDAKTAAKSDLFGLLGESRVQLVHVSEEERINAFFDLAIDCERKGRVTATQDLRRDSAESFNQQLRDTIIKTFGSEQALPAMHPVIMFRLCIDMCNHTGVKENKPTSVTLPSRRGHGSARGRGRGR